MRFLILILFFLSAFQVMAQSRVTASSGEVTLHNSHTALVFDAQRLRLKSWHDRKSGQTIFKGCGRSLFTISLGSIPLEDYKSIRLALLAQTSFPSVSWKEVSRRGGKALELHYDNAPVGDTLTTISVTVEVFLPDESPLASWGMKIDNRSNMPLQEVEFPQLIGLNFPDSADASEREYAAIPLYSGIKCFNPRKRVATNQGMSNYPGGGLSAQVMSYCNDRGSSFYYAAHDSGNYTKTFSCVPAPGNTVAMSNFHYSDTATAPGVWTLPYPVVTGPVAGDWYDCARIYRQWTLEQPRWTPLHKRTDINPAFRDLAVWWVAHPYNKKLADGNPALAARMERIKKEFFPGIPMALHWYMWYNSPRHDVDYPDIFLRSDDVFKKSVKAMQQADVTPMLYTNILLFETFLPGWKEAQKYAGRGPYNQLNRDVGKRMWRADDKRFITGMCFGTEYWVNKVTEIYRVQYEDIGTRFFYLDQLCNYPARCHARNHDHPASGGNYIAEGERRIARNIRNFGAPGEIAIVGEGVTEIAIDAVDGLLNGHCDTDPESIPIFQTIYSDRTTEIGCFIGRRDLDNVDTIPAKMAFNLVRGRQLGWVNEDQFDAFAPGNRTAMETIARYARVRMAVPEFLFYGTMLRTPSLSDVSTVTLPWYTWVRGKLDQKTIPVVFTECYRSPDGRVGVILANHTAEVQSVQLRANWKDWGFDLKRPLSVRTLNNLSWGAPETGHARAAYPLTIPPRDAIVVEFSQSAP